MVKETDYGAASLSRRRRRLSLPSALDPTIKTVGLFTRRRTTGRRSRLCVYTRTLRPVHATQRFRYRVSASAKRPNTIIRRKRPQLFSTAFNSSHVTTVESITPMLTVGARYPVYKSRLRGDRITFDSVTLVINNCSSRQYLSIAAIRKTLRYSGLELTSPRLVKIWNRRRNGRRYTACV